MRNGMNGDRGRGNDRFEWTSRGTMAALVVWGCLLITGLALYARGGHALGIVVAMAGFFVAPFVMVLAGRAR